MLSSVLDIYVITANSPEFTKYDIFSRLNKGAEKLKVNEIRKAVYQSAVLKQIDSFIRANSEGTDVDKNRVYKSIFTPNDIKRYEDYGRFYTSVAFAVKSDIENAVVNNYNSRPRDMINVVLQEAQNNNNIIEHSKINDLLEYTIKLKLEFVGIDSADYIINSCIPFVLNHKSQLDQKLNVIKYDSEIVATLATSNVNERLKRVKELVLE